jgi:hypothetical protein
MRKYNKVRDVNKTVYAFVCLFVSIWTNQLVLSLSARLRGDLNSKNQ